MKYRVNSGNYIFYYDGDSLTEAMERFITAWDLLDDPEALGMIIAIEEVPSEDVMLTDGSTSYSATATIAESLGIKVVPTGELI